MRWRRDEDDGSITISRRAQAYALEHGGYIYLWTSAFGGGFNVMRATSDRPGDLEFDTWRVVGNGVVVLVESGVEWGPVAIRLRRLPPRKLVVTGPWGSTGGQNG